MLAFMATADVGLGQSWCIVRPVIYHCAKIASFWYFRMAPAISGRAGDEVVYSSFCGDSGSRHGMSPVIMTDVCYRSQVRETLLDVLFEHILQSYSFPVFWTSATTRGVPPSGLCFLQRS